MSRKKASKCFVLAWDMYGLESVIPISAIQEAQEAADKQRIINILSDPDCKDTGNSGDRQLNQMLNSLLLRAKFNSQRCYEVYSIHVDPSIDGESLREMFNQDPQGSAELVRNRGNKIYSDRQTKKQLIT